MAGITHAYIPVEIAKFKSISQIETKHAEFKTVYNQLILFIASSKNLKLLKSKTQLTFSVLFLLTKVTNDKGIMFHAMHSDGSCLKK